MTDILLQIGAEFPGADKVNQQLNKLDRSLDESVKAANRFEREIKRLNAAKKKGTVTDQGYNAALQQSVSRLLDTSAATERQTQSLQRNVQATERATQATARANTTQQAARTQFLATANSIAVLDGPLGGVASRFSAFGVLIGRIGIPLAGLSVGLTTLSVAVQRGTRAFIEYETQLLRLDAILTSTGNSIGMTAKQVSNLSEAIALSTLESADAVREAATRIARFRNVTVDSFEDILRSAADLSAGGFGDLASSAEALASAIENPTRALQRFLERGIITAAQRDLIRNLVETGERAEALEQLIGAVNDRFGGAAQAQAAGYAGAIDTIRQAFGLLSRDIGEGFLGTRAGQFLLDFAETIGKLVQNAELLRDPQQRLQEIVNEGSRLRTEIAALEKASEGASRRSFDRTIQARQAELEALRAEAAEIRRGLAEAATGAVMSNVRASEQNLEILQSEINTRRQNIGLTREQIEINNRLREIGAFGLTDEVIERRVEDFRDSLLELNRDLARYGQETVNVDEKTQKFLETLKGLLSAGDELQLVSELEKADSAIQQQTENLREQDALQRAILENLQQGMPIEEARSKAAQDVRNEMNEAFLALLRANEETKGLAEEFEKVFQSAKDSADEVERIVDARAVMTETDDFLQSLNQELEILTLQRNMIAEGADQQEIQLAVQRAQIKAQLAIHEAEIARLRTNEGLSAEMRQQLAIQQAQIQGQMNLVDQGAFDPPPRGPRGPSGGVGAPDAIERLQQQLDREIQLLQVFGDQRLEMEARFRVYDAMSQAGIQLSEDQKQALVDQIMLTHELKRAEEERIETQRKLEQAQERAAQRMTDLFMAATQGGDAFKRTLANIIQELARMAAMRAFQSIIGGSGGGGGFLSFLFNEKGNIFQGGSVKAFAKGGVVDGPTMFPMKGAQTGLMGEAGPEAIIPLKRARDGSLGVQGGVTNAVSVTYAPQISVKGSGEEVAALRQEIARMNAEAPARIISTIQKAQKKRVL